MLNLLIELINIVVEKDLKYGNITLLLTRKYFWIEANVPSTPGTSCFRFAFLERLGPLLKIHCSPS